MHELEQTETNMVLIKPERPTSLNKPYVTEDRSAQFLFS